VWESRQPIPSTPAPGKPAKVEGKKDLKARLKDALKEAMTSRDFEKAKAIILRYERETGEKFPGKMQKVERNRRIQAKAFEKAPERGRKRK
jgi:Fic family protein